MLYLAEVIPIMCTKLVSWLDFLAVTLPCSGSEVLSEYKCVVESDDCGVSDEQLAFGHHNGYFIPFF